jgi:RNA polymerase sigma factor (TIGR02999 family)
MSLSGHEVTQLLIQWSNGDKAALDRLIPLVYRELHKLAKRYMGKEGHGNTLQTTAVIHEAYLKLAGNSDKRWENRDHFFAVAAKVMRHVLVDHARSKQTAKRGGEIQIVPVEENMIGGTAAEIVALDDALDALARLDARKAQVVEYAILAA